MKERVSRRNFLRMSGGIAAGVVVEEITVPVKQQLERGVSSITGHPTGNAQFDKSAVDREIPSEEKIIHTVVPPVIEEPIFRGAPSYVLNTFEKSETPLKDVMTGTGGIGLTRKEVLTGGVMALVFAGLHNKTEEEFDRKTIPVSQFLLGAETWYLQRKAGLPSAMVAHGWNNYKYLQK